MPQTAGSAYATFTVKLSKAPVLAPINVPWRTEDATAFSGTDYQASSGILTFGIGVSEQTFQVLVYGQPEGTPEKKFRAILDPPSGWSVETPVIECLIVTRTGGVISLVIPTGPVGPQGPIGPAGPTYTLQPATGYSLGGVKVGSGLGIDGTGTLSVTYAYTLPRATTGSLGGVKVGSGLAIDENGVLSATYSYTLPAATTSAFGGVKVGDNITLASGVISLSQGNVIAALGYTPVDRANGVFTGTGQIALPSGTTAQRPGSPVPGIRYNRETSNIEGYASGSWVPLGGSVSIASASSVGGVKVGSGLWADASGRLLSQTGFEALAYENIAINPRHVISQEKGSALVSAVNDYVTDGWIVSNNGIVVSGQQVASPFSMRPDLTNGLRTVVTTATGALSAGNFLFIFQFIDGLRFKRLQFGSVTASPLLIAFTCRSNVATTGYVALRNYAANRCYLHQFSVTANTDTLVSMVVPGDVTGTWVTSNMPAASVCVVLASGSTYQTASSDAWISGNYIAASSISNFAATVGNTFTISDLILLPVPDASIPASAYLPADRLPFFERHYEDELRLCQRYYQKTFPMGISPADNAGQAGALIRDVTATAQYYNTTWRFTVPMRAIPSISFYSPSGGTSGYWRNASNTISSQPSAVSVSDSGLSIFMNNGNLWTGPGADVFYVHATADARLR